MADNICHLYLHKIMDSPIYLNHCQVIYVNEII